MKRTLFLIGMVALAGLACCKNSGKQKAALNDTASGINIAATTGLLSEENAWQKYIASPKVTDEEQKTLRIAEINHEDFVQRVVNAYIAKGKEIYKGDSGRIETLFLIVPEHLIREYLVSYNAAGDYVDCVRIGEMGLDQGTAKIEGSTVSYALFWTESDDEGGTVNTQYAITPELKFEKEKEWEEPLKK